MATINSLLELARRQLGVKEDPPGSNKVKYNTWYYGREVSGAAYPWCMVFVQWVFDRASVKLPTRTASCGALMRAAQAAGCWVTKGYRPGDVVIYDFPGGAATDHCGIVEAVDGSRASAIEGNTSAASDLGVASLNLKSAVQGAWLNVLINLAGIKDEAFVAEYKSKGEAILAEALPLADEIYNDILKSL